MVNSKIKKSYKWSVVNSASWHFVVTSALPNVYENVLFVSRPGSHQSLYLIQVSVVGGSVQQNHKIIMVGRDT